MADVAKRDWKKIVKEEDPGSMFFVPEKLQAKVKDWSAKRAEFNKQLEGVAKNEIVIGNLYNEIMLDMRNHIADAGFPVWQKDVGINNTALKDGEFIVNVSDQIK